MIEKTGSSSTPYGRHNRLCIAAQKVNKRAAAIGAAATYHRRRRCAEGIRAYRSFLPFRNEIMDDIGGLPRPVVYHQQVLTKSQIVFFFSIALFQYQHQILSVYQRIVISIPSRVIKIRSGSRPRAIPRNTNKKHNTPCPRRT